MARPKILVVDDEPFNVDFLEQELDDLGYDTVAAFDGRQAIERVRDDAPDLVLLDIMMPVMDGFAVLDALKHDLATRDIPVVIISAANDLRSIVRGIQNGAEDFLPKPFEPVLLHARIRSGLDRKLRRDRELEYLRQVERLTAAAESVQAATYDEASIESVAARPDALGNLARVFRKMAQEVVAREQRLHLQLRQLQQDIEERRASASDRASTFVPMDRRQELANGGDLAQRSHGAALFADISGFTPLTESLARELGLQRGAEEVTRQVNRVFAVLIGIVHAHRGSVVGFAGDAITCWFEHDNAERAVACALAMQSAMSEFADIIAPSGLAVSIGLKIALACGAVRRLLVGDPAIQVLDVLAGRLMDELADAERHAARGEIVATEGVVAALGPALEVSERRGDRRLACIASLRRTVTTTPWPDVHEDAIGDERSRTWMPPAVYAKVRSGQSEYLSELRPAASLFMRFGGIDYDNDDDAQAKLDALTRWVQAVAASHDGTVLQLTIGDKGSHFHVTFGAPVAHFDDVTRAVRAALSLQSPPMELAYVRGVAVGLAYGPVRAGAYGSPQQRAYTVMGDAANLAARLMTAAADSTTLCDDGIHAAARDGFVFETLQPITVKGRSATVIVHRVVSEHREQDATLRAERTALIDRLPPARQLALKAASAFGSTFPTDGLRDVYPDERERPHIAEHLAALVALRLITPASSDDRVFAFVEHATREAAYSLMLFAQRRQLHRAIAEWHERAHAADLAPHFATLARHWRSADEPVKALHYLEQAGAFARRHGRLEEAQHYFSESLEIDKTSSVLSSDYRG